MRAPPSPPEFRLGHRPWLDGLRGLAVLAVLAYHFGLLEVGFLGVDVFFVLSGFLITALLAQEWRDNGTVRVGAFYLRRALRLVPALALALLACLVLTLLLRPAELEGYCREAALAAAYVANWQPRLGVDMPTLGHCWSLSIEEQFYLLWPPLLLLMLRSGMSKRSVFVMVAGLVAASALWRAVQFAQTPESLAARRELVMRSYMGLDTRADALLRGCLVGLATVWGALPRSPALRRALGAGALAFVAAVAFFAPTWHFGHRYWHYGGFTLAALATASLLACLLAGGLPGLRGLLEARPLVGLGRISYGLYLAHIPVIHFLGATKEVGLGASPTTLLALTLTLAAALLSYFVVERPCLRLKECLSRRPAARLALAA